MGIFTRVGNRIIWQMDGEKLMLEPWGVNSLRVRSRMMGEILDSDFALLPAKTQPVQIDINEHEAVIANGKIKAVLKEEGWSGRCQISFYNDKGELLLREIGQNGALNLRARGFKPIIGGDYRLTVAFESNENEKLYGMGQYQQEIMNIKNCSFELAHRNSQASIPFVLSSLGYGFLWHNPAIGRASFSKNKTEWYAESTKQMDYWITAGDTPAEVVERYADVTGKVPMMPEYGLGFWQCKLRYYNQEQLLEVAREYKRRNLPIDVIVCDFFHWPKMGDFRFDEEFFPDPQAMVAELKEMGIELMVSVWPQIDLESENYNEMKSKGFLVKPEMGVNISMLFGGYSNFFDATNPEARKYVWEKCRKNYYDYGIKIFWLDEAEPEFSVYDFDNYRYYLGPNVQIGNIYPQLYSRAFYEGMKAEGQQNIINLVRCAWAGSQRYGALVWSGDIFSNYEDFRKQICAGLHMGLCGIPWWTTDIGGFHGGDPDDEGFRRLLVRWFQYGTFCPVMRLHGDRKPSTKLYRKDGSPALFTGGNNEVWSFGEETYEILKKYMNIREKIRPYTRELMRQAHEKGTPVMRTMFYEFPDDEICWELKEQYMFGSDLLVAPVVYDNMTSRKVYLPKGAVWTNLHDGKQYEGGQFVLVDAPLDVIPVFTINGRRSEWIGII
ncbi:MAG TPA: family 31 glucosidase [Ruminiclostridium sp.]|nr:glycoside hydrolase family 31 protein [Clostridiaceae bacterium]HAA24959.1 family 31 glucosidase [Ruminiclostridium sp.]